MINLDNQRLNSLIHRGGVVVLMTTLAGCLSLFGCGKDAISSVSTVAMPDVAGGPVGKGFTCTGLNRDASSGEWLVGNVGQDLPTNEKGVHSTIVRLSGDFSSVLGEIDLHDAFPAMKDIQGLCVDGTDQTIWFCSFGEGKVRHITRDARSLGEINIDQPTGIAYDSRTDTIWVLTYAQLIRFSKDGKQLESFDVNVKGQDQLWLDEANDVMYFTGGINYTDSIFKGDNAVWSVDLKTGAFNEVYVLADSYAVEGLYMSEGKMYVLNDGYYHSAKVPVNQVNVYDIER